jgi:DNA-binding CsgD family transcriptional regulator
MIAPRARTSARQPASPVRRRECEEPREGPTAKALGDLVGAIGTAVFPDRFLDAMRALTGVELCSVFRHQDGDGMQLLFAAGEGQLPDFPIDASRDYARGYWRSDAQLRRLAHSSSAVPVIVRRHVSEIADPAYRAACYERANVVERVSILWPGNPGFVANGYRTAAGAPLTMRDVDRLESYAGLLIAALAQHLRADAATGHLFNQAGLVERLLAFGCGLSTREAEVAAALILGETQDEIARALQLSTATVVTYRRRAYGKLSVASRRELVALHRRLIVEPREVAR